VSGFLVALISGLVAGAIYSLYACGLTLTVSATGIYNLAFGAFAFVGGLTFFEASSGYIPRWAAFVLTVFVAAPVGGLFFEQFVFRKLSRVPEVARLMGTIGILVGLPALSVELVDILTNDAHLGLASIDQAYSVPGIGPEPPHVYHFLKTGTLTSDQIAVLIVTAVAVAAVWTIMTKTRMGLMTRAVVDRSVLASTRGISPKYTSRVTWILSSMLAALAGILAGPIFGLSVDSVLDFVVAGSAVVVVARFRSLPVAMLGGLALGALSSMIATYGNDVPIFKNLLRDVPGSSASVVYVALLVALLFRGRERGRVAGVTAVAEPVPNNYLSDLPKWRQAWPWVALCAGILLWGTDAIPWSNVQAGGLEQLLIVQALGLAVVFLSFNVVVGQLGVASMAQAAMVTSGALMAGIIAGHHFLGGNFVVCMIAAGLSAALIAAVIALPAFRLGGLALALATLALGLIADQALFQVNVLSNYGNGWNLTRPILGPINFTSNKSFIVLLFLFLGGALLVVNNIRRSKTGRAILAVRFAPAAASASGISTRRAIVSAFAISGFLAGTGGALLAYGAGSANATTWPTETGLLWLMIAVTQGVRRPSASILGGIFATLTLRVLQTGFWGITPAINNPVIPEILFGLTCVLLANQPDGVLHQTSEQNFRRRAKWRARKAGKLAPADVAVLEPGLDGVKMDSILADLSAAGVNGAAVNGAGINGNSAAHSAGPAVPSRGIVGDSSVTPALAISGLVAGYSEAEVLHGVDLVVPPGSIVAVLGPNGTGKSTLCGAVAGTVHVTAGTVSLFGQDITSMEAYERCAAGIMIAPESRGIFPALTVEENLAVSLRSAADRNLALERFPQLAARRKLPASNLSGGEQQMLCLAPILVHPPRLLIADEISLGLAPTIVREVLGILEELRAEGLSILMVEEKAVHVVDLADYGAFLSFGVVSHAGPMSDLTDEVAAEAYLGSGSKA
jgi:ABC-type branched-subunit amino acid transport system ATPase component/branched-subunit amino acid ABC-type transport system permease component